jgi:hypothetical protein
MLDAISQWLSTIAKCLIQTRIAYFEEVVSQFDDMIPGNWLKIGSENYKILLA